MKHIPILLCGLLVFTVAPRPANAQLLADAQRGATSRHRPASIAQGPRVVEAAERSTRASTARWDHARKGTLWGLGIYAAIAGAFIVHERMSCDGSDCFGEGMAWIGLAEGVPLSMLTGFIVGYAWPVRAEANATR